MANVSVFVTFRNLVHFPWKKQTTYFSVEVSVPKSLVTKKNWDAIIERASEEFFNSSPMEGVSSHRHGTHHRHRSIDEMRIHHLVLQRKVIHEQGGTTPGLPAHVSIWL